MFREPPPSPAANNNPIKIFVLADRVYENVQLCNFGSGTTSIFALAAAPTINDPPTPSLTPNFYGSLTSIYFEVTVSNTIPAGGDLVITMPAVVPWTTNPYSVIVLSGLKAPLMISRALNIITIRLSQLYRSTDGVI